MRLGRVPSRAGAAAALGLIGAALLFWRIRIIDPATVPYVAFANGDFFLQIYPMSLRAAGWWHQGVVPLWNPYQSCGLPFAATGIYGVFYPLNFPYLLVPTELAIEVVTILHLALAGLFMHAYGRSIGLDRPSAMVAGGTFMLSGYVTGQAAWFTPALAATVWLPLGLVAIERIVEKSGFSAAILLAVAVAMGGLCGWPQLWLYTLYVLAAYAAVRLLVVARGAPRAASRASALVAGGLFLGLCLAAIQLLPELELQRLGPRRQGALSSAQLVSFAFMLPGTLLAQALDSAPGVPRLPYLGMAVFVLAPASLWAKGLRSRVLCLWFVALGSVGAVLSVSTPFFDLYRALPGVTWFRAMPRMLFIYAFAGAALSGIGFSVLANPAGPGASPTRAWVPRGLATAIAVLLLAFAPMSWPSRTHLACALGACWVIGFVRQREIRVLFASGFILAIFAELGWATRNDFFHPYHGVETYEEEREALDFVHRSQRYDRTYIHGTSTEPAVMPKQGTLREIYSITDYEPLSLSRYEAFFRVVGPALSVADSAMTFTGGVETNPTVPGFRLLDLLSVRYVIVERSDDDYREALEQHGWSRAFFPKHGHYVVYERSSVMPRASVPEHVSFAANGESALAAISDPSFDPRSMAILEPQDPRSPQEAGSLPPPHGSARIVEYTPTLVTISVDVEAPGFLILSDTNYPGWKADVDGRVTPIHQANFLFRGIRVPVGSHRVTFRYEPMSLRWGALVSLAGSLLIVFYGIVRGLRFFAAPA